MNLILFARDELGRPLAAADERARHVRDVLKRKPGEPFDLGVIDGPRGKGRVEAIGTDGGVTFSIELGAEPPPLAPLHLVIGLPRPQTAKKILNEATALGVAALHFVVTERTEPGYAQSTLWRGGEWRTHAIEGAQQAFCTRLPRVTAGRTLAEAITDVGELAGAARLALDNYEAGAALGAVALPDAASAPLVAALGPERGWGPKDRDALRAAGFTLVHLGERVLRVETATVATIAILRARRGWT